MRQSSMRQNHSEMQRSELRTMSATRSNARRVARNIQVFVNTSTKPMTLQPASSSSTC